MGLPFSSTSRHSVLLVPRAGSARFEGRELPLRRLIPGLTGLCLRNSEFRFDLVAQKLYTISSAEGLDGGDGGIGKVAAEYLSSLDVRVPVSDDMRCSWLIGVTEASSDGRLRRGRDINDFSGVLFADLELFFFVGVSSMSRHSREWEVERFRSRFASSRRFGSDPTLANGRDLVPPTRLCQLGDPR